MRARAIPALDCVALPQGVTLGVYIDDYGLSATGPGKEVVRNLSSTAKKLLLAIKGEMGAKTAFESSSSPVASELRSHHGALAGPISGSAANLGIDDAAGRPRRTAGRGKKFAVRKTAL